LEETLKSIYYNIEHPSSYGSVAKLYSSAKKIIPTVTLSQVKDWLSAQDPYTLHRKVVRKFQHVPVRAEHVDHIWQMDTADVKHLESENDGIKFLFIIIDVISRFAFVIPMKNKNSGKLVKAFMYIQKKYNREPRVVVSDPGLEFRGKFTDYMKKRNIRQFLLRVEQKAAIAERFIRTLKEKMQKYMTHMKTKRYVNILREIVRSYNTAVHSRLKKRPIDINSTNEDEIKEILYSYANDSNPLLKKSKYKLGDMVRIVKKMKTFDKTSLEKSTSDEVYIIKSINRRHPPRILYKLVDIEGEYIRGLFYPEELVLVAKVLDPRVYMHTGKKRVKTTKRKTQTFKTYQGWRRKFDKLLHVSK